MGDMIAVVVEQDEEEQVLEGMEVSGQVRQLEDCWVICLAIGMLDTLATTEDIELVLEVAVGEALEAVGEELQVQEEECQLALVQEQELHQDLVVLDEDRLQCNVESRLFVIYVSKKEKIFTSL